MPKKPDDNLRQVREACEADLYTFACVVNPHREYGEIHKELFDWWTRPAAKDNSLVLLPRDHQKSHCAAVYAAWMITRDPTQTILYVSATSALAEKQLYAIKGILTSDTYMELWPDMVNVEEGKREKWNNTEICVDHPLRKQEGVRDSTIFAAGLTTNITGFHASTVFLDDVVVPGNAYTKDGREKVTQMYSQLASIETTGAKEIAVGTRYHPQDLYQTLIEMEEDIFNDEGEHTGAERVYETFIRVVEVEGVFLWPRKARESDGKFYGFDLKELARKKAKYVDRTQFYAQYYNDPNDPESARLTSDRFQYYDKKFVSNERGTWFFKGNRLNVVAAVDFAFSLAQKADFTAIVVVGIDSDGQIYVLDIDRFKTDKIGEYYDHLFALHKRWGFRKLRAEVTAAQKTIVRDLKMNYIVPNGLGISIDEHNPTRHEGSKEERIAAILEPRYDNMSIWHYKGGYTPALEEEVLLARPAHDDIKDALACAIDAAVPPARRQGRKREKSNVIFDSRFGGTRFK